MSSDLVIEAVGLGKAYTIFKRPQDRLKQMLSRGRRRYYEEYWALRDVNLEIRRGETVALIGHNGAGKSTFLQLLCGTVTPSVGHIAVAGRVGALLELGAGFNPEFTGRENMHLAASVLGLTPDEIAARADAIEEFAGIGDFIDQPVKLYSSGMYARLAFAVMAHVNPDVLIVDEILSVGDAAFQQKCMRFIRTFKENGTLLFVSHDVNAVLSLCDRAVWLDAGTVRMIGDARDVVERYQAAVEGGRVNSNAFKIGGSRKAPPEPALPFDKREGLLAGAGLRPNVQIFQFDPDAPWFGQRGATIENVHITNSDGQRLDSFPGGELITLHIEATAHTVIQNPIIGFFVKDRLGQHLFGDNTYLTHVHSAPLAEEGSKLAASFEFRVPYMPVGDYSVTVAIAAGTQDDHIHHHWVEDAMFLKITGTNVVKGLLGIPMKSINLQISQTADL